MPRNQELHSGSPFGEDQGWWAVYTKHQHEKVVAEIASQRKAEVFLPLYSSMRRWKTRNVKLSLPLFPGYVFIRAQEDLRLKVLSVPGVFTIVTHGTRFALVSDLEIQTLRRAVEGPNQVGPYPYLRTGERVRITRGALQGVEGILVRQKNLCRVVISLEMLAHSAAVEVNAWDVAPVTTSQDLRARVSPSGISNQPGSEDPDYLCTPLSSSSFIRTFV